MMKKIVCFLLLSVVLIPAYSWAAPLPAYIIEQLQDQFRGRVVGVAPYRGNQHQVQILDSNGNVIIVTVNSETGQVVKIQR